MLNVFDMFKSANFVLDESVRLPVYHAKTNKADANIRIMIRNRWADGRSGNPIRHATSIKIYESKSNVNTISIPIVSGPYTKDDIKALRTSLKGTGVFQLKSDVQTFIESFIYDNQYAIIAYWYIDHMTVTIKDAFDEYFKNQVHMNHEMYSAGKVLPKSKTELIEDRKTLIDYMQQVLGDPSFTLYELD